MLAQTQTHATLLARVASGADPRAWAEFVGRYGELIRGFARRQRLQDADLDDVTQDVLMALSQAMPGFRYDPARGKFRSYLKTAVLHAIYRRSRQNGSAIPLEVVQEATRGVAADDSVDELWEVEWRQYHLRTAMRVIDSEFNEQDRAAFERYAVGGMDVKTVAQELGMSVDQVYQAKSRISKRLMALVAAQVEEEG